MDGLIFCISQNNQYYYEKAFGISILNWQLFLVMNPIGFNYYGFIKGNYEVLNGVNADSETFVSRAEEAYGFSRVLFDSSVDDLRVWQSPHMIIVDDYYMPYHPSYKKNHYERFVISQSREDDHAVVFDMESHTIPMADLRRAAGKIFTLTLPDMTALERINSMLLDEHSNKRSILSKKSIENMHLFLSDFKKNKEIWGPEEFESLFFFINKLGGPTATRRATGLALNLLMQSTSTKEKLNILEEKAQMCKILANEWDIIGSLFFKASKLNRNHVLDRIEERLKNVIGMEKEL